MDPGSDNSLMWAVRSGEIDKLGPLFERHKHALFGYFYRVTHNAQASEDLVQTVFLRILTYRSRFSGQGKFAAWMYHIAHNVCSDHYRKEDAHRRGAAQDEWEPMEAQTAEGKLLGDERLYLLEQALTRLTPEQREILVLAKFQGLDYREIGQILNCSAGAVKVRVFRAVQKLKQVYLALEG